MTKQRIVFVTGLSGAGKSQAMKTFEDLGFYCVDNLPPALAPQALKLLTAGHLDRIAVALDVRSGGPLGEAQRVFDGLQLDHVRPEIVFLEAQDETLVRRYSETRRRHPLAGGGTLIEAIAAERASLAPVRERSTQVIDTTALTHAALKERIATLYGTPQTTQLLVVIIAFGFKYGIPLDIDLLFDVRFLQNPNYIEDLKPLTGSDAAVGKFIKADPAYEPFMMRLNDLLDFLVPRYLAEGKSQLTIGIGCTGGRHRSVFVAEELTRHFEANEKVEAHVDLRDVTR
ncbi:MAG: RNase adapter RapZ [Candidatus Eremiobacteraeota bacterium]|nr:RNase adapter RapZ [Candidatus Eremiobacteraeota bacterium]